MSDKFIPFCNDRMFCSVLARNPDLAKAILETILGVVIDHVECVNAQKILNYSKDGKSVRLDVFLKDGQKICYDIEMETSKNTSRLKVLPIRSRLYGGAIDMEVYPRGTNYDEVKNVFVIFICLYDPFDRGLARYDSSASCVQNNTVGVHNGITYVYLNCSAKTWNVSQELKSLLSYIKDRNVCETELTQRIDEAVKQFNEDSRWRNWGMTIEQKIEEERYFSKLEGREEERAATIASMIKNGFDDNQITSVYRMIDSNEISAIRRQITQA